MTTIPINLPRPHDKQLAIIRDKARFRVVACGRRFGKTEAAKHETVLRLLKGQHIWYCAPTNKLAKKIFKSIANTLRYVPNVYVNYSDLRLELPTGGWLEAISLQEPDNLRGEGLNFVVMDEAAFVKDGVWDRVLRPMLATSQGGALFISSPYGRNWFWQLHTRGNDPLEPLWSSHHYTSADGGLISEQEMADIKRGTPERIFEEEYLAEFKEDSGSVFRGVDDAIRVYGKQNPQRGMRYVFGVDWARDNDYTVIVVMDAATGDVVHMDRFNEISYTLQQGRIVELANTWKPALIVAEHNSIGSVNIEALQYQGLPVEPFMTTAQSKSPLIESLALAVESGTVGLLDDEILLNELKAYELERMPSGKYRYGAPSGGHDDTVIALALAWHGSTMPSQRLVYDDSMRVSIGW